MPFRRVTSPRRKNNFVKVNCSSLHPSLFESEMLGYAKGAFTGATSKRIGPSDAAHHGAGMPMLEQNEKALIEKALRRAGAGWLAPAGRPHC